jgi:hypothetical protein
MARFLQDRSCNDDFVPIATPHIVDNSMDMDVEGKTVDDNNIEEIIINIYANDEMEVDEYVIQENKKRKREDDDLMDKEEKEDDEELDEDYELEDDDLMYEEEGDVYQHVAILEAENEDLRQQLANANNTVPSRIPFPDGYYIGFEYVNGVRYLFVYQQPVNNSPLSLADLQDDEDEDEDDDDDGDEDEDEVLSIINPDDIIKEKESDDEEEDNEDDDEMDMSK